MRWEKSSAPLVVSSGSVHANDHSSGSTTFPMRAHRAIAGITLFISQIAIAESVDPSSTKVPPGVALAKFEKGKSAFDKKLYEEALRYFGESNELQASPNTRLYLARCHHALGRIGRAFILYRQAALESKDSMAASGDQRFSGTLATARKEAAAIESRVPHVVLAVPADLPEQFVVKLDGAEIPRSTWGTSIEVDPGPHQLVSVGPRFARIERKIVLREGELQRIELRPQHKPTATLEFRFPLRPDGLAVTLDGKALLPDRIDQAQDVDVGAHEVVAQAPGYLTYRWRGELQDGDRDAVKVSLAARTGTPLSAFMVSAGATLAALAVGTGLRITAENTQNQELSKPQELREPFIRDSVRTMGTVSTVAFVAGGVFAVPTVILGFTTRWRNTTEEQKHRPRQSALTLAPWLGSQTVGLSLSGRM